MPLTHVFFDIGGVLGTNGWDREQRSRALEKFGVEDEEFEHRHHQVVSEFETGAMSLEEYLDVTVFHTPRLFSREDFELYMLSLSEPNPYSIQVARHAVVMLVHLVYPCSFRAPEETHGCVAASCPAGSARRSCCQKLAVMPKNSTLSR